MVKYLIFLFILWTSATVESTAFAASDVMHKSVHKDWNVSCWGDWLDEEKTRICFADAICEPDGSTMQGAYDCIGIEVRCIFDCSIFLTSTKLNSLTLRNKTDVIVTSRVDDFAIRQHVSVYSENLYMNIPLVGDHEVSQLAQEMRRGKWLRVRVKLARTGRQFEAKISLMGFASAHRDQIETLSRISRRNSEPLY